MTESPAVRHFDHHSDPNLLADPYAVWARIRETTPSFLSTAGPRRIWYVTRYEDVRAAAEQPDLFSSRSILPFEADSERPNLIPEEMDPPEHTAYRQVLTPHFSASEARRLEPAARQTCVNLVNELASAGRCDFVRDFARPYSGRVLMRLLGIPMDDADTFLGWVNNLMIARPEDDPDGSIRMGAAMAIYSYLGQLVGQRYGAPGDDLTTALIGHTVNERPLDAEEVVKINFQLCMAGIDTLAGVLGYVFKHLAENEKDRAIVRTDTSDPVLEELLRCFTVTAPGRVVTRDTEFGGCPMRAGDRLVLPFAAANGDPAMFPNPDRVDLQRKSNRHVAFGAGPHRCVGAAMSRMELRVALQEWHARVPDYQVEPGATVTQHVGSVAGLDQLPLVWNLP
jgi:cytochrome P450